MISTQDDAPPPDVAEDQGPRRRTLFRSALTAIGLLATFIAGAWLSTLLLEDAEPTAALVVDAEPRPAPPSDPLAVENSVSVPVPVSPPPMISAGDEAKSLPAVAKIPMPAADPLPTAAPGNPQAPVVVTASAPALPATPTPVPTPVPAPTPATPVQEPAPKPATEVKSEPGPFAAIPEAKIGPAVEPVRASKASPAKLESVSEVSTPARAERGRFTVQVGSFSIAENADRLVGALAERGFDAHAFNWTDGEGKIWRVVRVGPLPTRSEADAIRVDIEAKTKERGEIIRLR